MTHEKIWSKVLGDNEKIEHQFSIGDDYVKFGIIAWGVISFFLLFLVGIGIFVFAIAWFYYKFYLKRANAYAFTNKRVLIHRGWLSTHTISIDYPKITDIHITEPFIDRLVTHTGDIGIITAGTTSDQVILEHIENPYEIKKKLDFLKDAFFK